MIVKTIAAFAISVLLNSCICMYSGRGFEDYNKVETAVRNLPETIYGEYGDEIPNSVTGDTVMVVLKRKQQYQEYDVLSGYELKFYSHVNYYYLQVLDKGCLILGDYSCTPIKVDSPVYRFGLQQDTLKNPCEK